MFMHTHTHTHTHTQTGLQLYIANSHNNTDPQKPHSLVLSFYSDYLLTLIMSSVELNFFGKILQRQNTDNDGCNFQTAGQVLYIFSGKVQSNPTSAFTTISTQ